MKEIEKEAYKQIPLNILIHVADFCKRNGIRYSLAYGTLLGAIRHKGFIPWDDDIDIIMPRVDYEKFKKLYHSDRYPLSDIVINKNHPTAMAKVYDTQTIFYNKKVKAMRLYGLFIDVFVVDNFPVKEEERQHWQNLTRLLMTVNEIKNSNFWGMLSSKKNLRSKIKLILYRNIPLPKSFIQRKISDLCQKYNSFQTGIVGITMSRDNPFDTYPTNLFEDFINVQFEGQEFKAIRQYDIWLKACYGDYMRLPPVEKRVGKHGIVAYYK